jgi:hypothetical protein
VFLTNFYPVLYDCNTQRRCPNLKLVGWPYNKSGLFLLELKTSSLAAAPQYKPPQACSVLMDFLFSTFKIKYHKYMDHKLIFDLHSYHPKAQRTHQEVKLAVFNSLSKKHWSKSEILKYNCKQKYILFWDVWKLIWPTMADKYVRRFDSEKTLLNVITRHTKECRVDCVRWLKSIHHGPVQISQLHNTFCTWLVNSTQFV